MLGKVKWFLDEEGYGYITSDDGNEYLATFNNVVENNTLAEGDRVRFDCLLKDSRPMAIDIETIK